MVTNIWDYTGGFCKLKHDLRKFPKLNLWFRNLRNCLSVWCGCLPMAITSSFQLRFTHRLKRWTPDFPSFECIKWTLGSTLNVSFSCSPLEFLHVRFLYLFFLLAFLIGFGKGLQSSKAWILHVNELSFAFRWTIQSSPSFLDFFGDKKAIKNTKTCHNLIRNTCKGS